MRMLTIKDTDLLSCFDEVIENEISNASLKQKLIDNHSIVANKGKIGGKRSTSIRA